MQNAVDYSKKSPKRDIPMVEIEVDSVTTQCLPNGWLVNPGKSTILIYEDELPEVEALTRTDEDNDLYQRAKTEYERRFLKWAEKECGGDIEKAEKQCPLSIESVFLSMNEGLELPHIKPLKSIKILKEGLPPPEEKKTWSAQHKSAEMIADVIEKLLTNEALIERIADAVSIRSRGQQSKKGN